MRRIHHQSLRVEFDYPIVFTRDALGAENSSLLDCIDRLDEGRRHKVLFFVDDGVAEHHPDLLQNIASYVARHEDRLELVLPPRIVVGGEAIKNDYRLTMEIVDTILEGCLCRHSFVVAIGGGAVLDAVGFATSIVHRGLRLIRMPTTVLGQNDSGVGVKNGMNLHGGKNTIGTFHPPFAVLNDFAFLPTLSDRDWCGGVAEAFKVAIIKDSQFFEQLCAKAPALRERNQAVMEEVVERCALLHLEHICSSGDAFELGQARPLDFGHWAAHRLESMSNYAIRHGEAVAVGIAIDSYYAWKQGWLETQERDAIFRGLEEAGLPLWFDALDRRLGDGRLELLEGLSAFQEHLGGELCVTYPNGLGARQEVNNVDQDIIEEAVAFLKARCTGATVASS